MPSRCLVTCSLVVSVFAYGCGGSGAVPEAAAPPMTGEPDASVTMPAQTVEFLACTAVELAPIFGTVRPFALGEGARTSMGTAGGLASSAQRDMAVSDALSAASIDRGAAQRQVRLAEEARRVEWRSTRTARLEEEPARLLEEYARLWARLVVEPGAAPEATARVAEIDEMYPEVTDAYVKVLVYAAREVDLGCGAPGS